MNSWTTVLLWILQLVTKLNNKKALEKTGAFFLLGVKMDKTKFCNISLGLISNGEIIDISSNDPKAQKCKLYFEPVAETALSYYNWSFARKMKTPAMSAETYEGFKYCYVYPAEAITVWQFKDENGCLLDLSGNAEIVLSENEASRLILSDFKIAKLIYTTKLFNPGMWPATFIEATSYLLANKVCEAIPALKKEAQSKYEQYATLIEMAKSCDIENELKFFDKNLYEGYQVYDGGIF